MTEPTLQLTEKQIDFFHHEGYLNIDAFVMSEEVQWLREIYDRLFEQRAGQEEGNYHDLAGTDENGKEAVLPQIHNPAKYAPELNNALLLVNTQAVARQLLGPEARCAYCHAIFKPAGVGAETPWHQDAAYWRPDVVHREIRIWVPLQEATTSNGCMQFVPRSHSGDVLMHQSINNDPRIPGLELVSDEIKRVTDVVSCPLPPGGATIHNCYTLHHTGPNRSDVPRRALILSGAVPATPHEPSQGQRRLFPWMEQKKTAPRRERVTTT